MQADKKHLEGLEEEVQEKDEQSKTYEDEIAGGFQEKEEQDSEKGSLQAQLANQLAVNRELEVRLAGLRKLEEEAGKNEPEPAVGTEPGKDAEPKPADKEEPSFVAPLNDVIAGKYDNDTDEMYRQIFYAWDNYRLDDSFGQPEYKALFNRAITHRRDIFLAFYEKVKDTANLPKHADVKASIEKMFARFEKDTSPEYKMERLNEIEEAFSWLGYSDLNSGETEPSPQITDPEPVPTEPIAPQTAAEPDWLKSMHDIIDGKYDNDPEEAEELIGAAIEELEKPDSDPQWEDIVTQASDHLTDIALAEAKALGF